MIDIVTRAFVHHIEKDFILGNKEHEKLLMKMGIQIMNKDGNVQLMHVADLAINAQYSEEGLVFMKEMIQLNEEATYPPEQEDAFRFVSILANEMPTLLAGPAQFGNNFKKGPLVGSIAKSKINSTYTLQPTQPS